MAEPTPIPAEEPQPAEEETPAEAATEESADDPAAKESSDEEEDSAPVALPRQVSRPTYQESTIKSSHQDPKFTAPLTGLTVRFLNGDFADQVLDLGSNVFELDEEQSANWGDLEGRGGRIGKNFNNISARTFKFSLDFYDPTEDISQLVENCAHMQEIMDLSSEPPILQLSTGVRKIQPVVCDGLSIHYDRPLPDQRGWRHATVQIGFFLQTSGTSEHFLATPLGPTPLGDYREKTTQAERQRQEQLSAIKNFLAPCLGEDGTKELTELIEGGSITDPEALAALSPDTLLQIAAGGLSPEMLQDSRVQASLRSALAESMASNENGVAGGEIRSLGSAILSGDPSGLDPKWTEPSVQVGADGASQTTTTFDSLHGDFDVSLQALINQDLGEDSAVYDSTRNPTARRRLSAAAGCGLQLRSSGMGSVLGGTTAEGEASSLASINAVLGDTRFSDDDLKQMFGLDENTPQTVIAQLRNGGPYTSQSQFLSHLNINRQGVTANGMLQAFKRNNAGALSEVNQFLQAEATTVDQIKERLGVSEEAAAELKGKSFTDRQSFVDAAGGGAAWEGVLETVNGDGFGAAEEGEAIAE